MVTEENFGFDIDFSKTPPLSPNFLHILAQKRQLIHAKRMKGNPDQQINLDPDLEPIQKMFSVESQVNTYPSIDTGGSTVKCTVTEAHQKIFTVSLPNKPVVPQGFAFISQRSPTLIEVEESDSQVYENGYIQNSSSQLHQSLIWNGERWTFNWRGGHLQFLEMIEECQRLIYTNKVKYPERIRQGSSGSYFVHEKNGTRFGIFKPKDEEPYAHLNPKWIKWWQKQCCPCTYGRPYLLPSCGYISEAAASIVDSFLGLDVVPRTQIAHISSPTLSYHFWSKITMLWNHNFSSRPFPYDISTVNLESGRNLDIRGSEGTNTNGDAINEAETSNDNQRNKDFNLKSNDHEIRYPLKIGSFQLYVHGFGTSDDALERLKTIEDIEIHRQFQLELERMIVLDYVIGNSDRTLNNWLVHISFNSNHSSFSINTANSPDAYENKSGKNGQFLVSINENKMNDEKSVDQYEVLTGERASIFTGQDENRIDSRRLKIACIDNGLAFPVRHPKKKEILPFTTTHSWSVLPQAQIPFSEGLKSRLLPILSDPMVWEVLVSRLRPIFLIDQDFCERTFKNQMSVMRGQLYNLVLSLRSDESPIQLLNREPLTVTGPEDPIFGPRNTF